MVEYEGGTSKEKGAGTLKRGGSFTDEVERHQGVEHQNEVEHQKGSRWNINRDVPTVKGGDIP